MIHFVLLHNEKGPNGFTCRGHAGYDDHGKDIVCAAVSALTTTCINALEAVAGIEPSVTYGKDNMLTARLPEGISKQQHHDAKIILKSLYQGMSDIREAYPECVTLKALKD